MRTLFTVLCITLLVSACSAQAQHTFWPFGFNSGLDFSSGTPVAISTPLSTDEGCASISDTNGQLLFYSNGETVWDRNNNVMPNGSGLFGSYSSSQSALIVPFPDDPQRFYLFTAPPQAGEWIGQPNAAYSIVDMAANGGNGDVVMANVLLDGPVTERLTATYHANGRDVWVLYHRWESDAYIAYLVTCQGVEGPVVSNIGQAMHGNPDGSGASPIGCMRMNQQGDRLANAWGRSMAITNSDWQSTAYFDVLDFDNSSGLLSIIRSDSIGGTVELFSRGYGVEFAPNGNLVYMSDHGLLNGGGYSTIRQYDLTSADPMNTEVVLATENRAFGSLQLAPDGKIYAARLNGATYLSAITNPDVVGPGCGFVDNAVSLGANPSTWGLPNHWDTYPTPPPDDPIALRDTLLCADSDPITLDATWTHPFQTPSYLWSTGETTASITVSSAGTYVVEVQLPCSTLTDTVQVKTGGIAIDLGEERSICEEDSVVFDVGPIAVSVYWSTGDTTHRIAVREEGHYNVTVADVNGCITTDAVFVGSRNCQCPLYLPNTFTPNGDGINDVLHVAMDCSLTEFEFVLFDRWGRTLHRTDDPEFRWSGDGVPVGVYAYTLNYAWQAQQAMHTVQRNGSVSLLR
ncbi:MAG: gliding motility-associated C-terminal domain-containing protein [Flavobacteriales bacterium]|jgi:gliding motility-associated-like protein|nr:gliding motility-associated C-terminal domain-containing protein [Flavobacteriales bacterium]MBK7103080.1 gliding motility-associated C-terminal domain-containing protein [Flavobacteriales bacterium]MBK7483056.1 gliding motility-associated C-terminal domain-containing protein [Flavobacteriales bacterium]MBP8877753.1 gliding motility-associated C-terminal domain-containing protein [Flavobacteriales bacterium]MBP9176633.1 gliding motility-associated C-terminal domain-containing protein [Flavob